MTDGSRGRWCLLGASGLVGSHIVRAIGARQLVTTSYRTRVAGAVDLDITDAAAVRRRLRDADPDIVVVAAADAFVERCEREPAATRAINVDAVRTIAESAPNALLVVFSSEYVYDG